MTPTDKRSTSASALRRQSETLALTQSAPSPAELAALSPEETWQMLHELRVHQIELELQNEELRRVQEELEGTKARYLDLYEMAPVGYCTLNEEKIILEANLTISSMLGIARGVLVNQPLSRFLFRDDQDIFYLLRKNLFANGKPQGCEVRMVRPGGRIFWVRLDAVLVTGAESAPQWRLAISDISQRKEAEEALRASEKHLRFLIQNASDSQVIVNPDGTLRYLSPAMEKITGFSPAVLEGQPFATFIHPEDTHRVRAVWEETLTHPETTVTLQFRHVHKSRGWVWVEAIAQSFLAVPLLNGVIASVRDISERHALERTVRQYQRDLEAIFNATTESIHLIDTQGTVLMANEYTSRRLGTTVEELVGRPIFDFFPPEVTGRRKENIRQVTSSGQALTVLDQRDGHSFESSLWPMKNADGDVDRIAIFCKEVTERVTAEQAFAHSQALLNATQQLSRVGGWEWNVEKQSLTWTDETYRIHGFMPVGEAADGAERIRRSLACYPPEDRAVVAAAFRRCIASGEPYDLRVRFVTFDGRALWIRTVAEPVWADGRVALVRGNIMDITRQVEQEQHLHIYRNMIASTTDAMAYIDQDYRYVVVNDAYERFSGINREHFIGLTVAEYLGEELFQEVIQPLFDRCLRGEVINYRRWFDYPALGRRYVDLSYFPYRDEHRRIAGIIAQTRDITDHVEAAEALRASEERFEAIVEACPLAVALIRNGRYHYVNPFARRLLDWPSDIDLATLAIEETIDPRYHEEIRSRIAAGTSGQANPPMELMLVRPDGRRVMTESVSMPIQLPDGPAILVMGTDITHLKKRKLLVRSRLRISEAAASGRMDDLLRLILDEAEILTDSRIGFFHFLEDDQQTLSLQAWSTSTLERFCQAEGKGQHYSIDEAGVWVDCIHQRQPVIHNDCAALHHRKGLPAGHAAVVRELLVPIFRGEKIVGVFGVGNKEQDYTPEDIELLTILGDLAWDIVLRKRAEEALRASEERFRLIFDRSPAGSAIIGPDFRLQMVNDSLCRFLGYSEDELRGRTFADITHPEDREHDLALVHQLLAGEIEDFDREKRYLHNNGETLWARVHVTLVRDADGQPLFFLPIILDIRERKEAEQALRESEARFRQLLESLPAVAIQGYETDGTVLYWNQASEHLYGFTAQEALGRNLLDLIIPPEMQGDVRQAIHDMAENGTPIPHAELSLLCCDGSRVTVDSSHLILDGPEGRPQLYCVDIDLTARKRMEVALQERQAYLQSIFRASPIGIGVVIDRMITDVNEQICALTGYSEAELLGQNARMLYPTEADYRWVGEEKYRQISRSGTGTVETRWQCKDGRIIDVLLSSTPIDITDFSQGVTFSVLDITERKQAEIALQASEELLRVTLGNILDPVFITDDSGRFTFICPNSHFALGYSTEEIAQLGSIDALLGADLLANEALLQQAEVVNLERPLTDRHGTQRVFLITMKQVSIGAGTRLFTMHDITERKQAEIRLQEQAAFNRRILDSTAAHIAILDPQGMIIDVNTPWHRFAQENQGTQNDKLGPGVSYFCTWNAQYGDITGAEQAFAGIRQVQCGERDSFEIEYPCHSPEENRWFSLRVLPLAGGEGQVLVSHTDVSALKQSEEHHRAALAEKEVLLREVHHRVKNNLAAIISLLDMQRRMLSDPQGKDILIELAGRIRSMSLIHEKLYRADNLARIDFQAYLKALISHLRTSYGSPRIQCRTEAQGVELPLDLAVPCGMIVNELMTNALKYAFPGDQPAPGKDSCRILVHMRQEKGLCTLSIADNGVGLPPGFDWTSATTLGMVLVRMLGRHQLGGTYTLDQKDGLRFTLSFSERRGKR
jgi:PAS domain S-box-containing protein